MINSDDKLNNEFRNRLIKICSKTEDGRERLRGHTDWEKAPGARYCHPREEHLFPLHVCAGLPGTEADLIFDDYIAGKRSVAFNGNRL